MSEHMGICKTLQMRGSCSRKMGATGRSAVAVHIDLSLTKSVIDNFDYCFSENGLTAFKLGQPLASASFIEFVGEEEYKKLVNFVLRYLADVDIPIKR